MLYKELSFDKMILSMIITDLKSLKGGPDMLCWNIQLSIEHMVSDTGKLSCLHSYTHLFTKSISIELLFHAIVCILK